MVTVLVTVALSILNYIRIFIKVRDLEILVTPAGGVAILYNPLFSLYFNQEPSTIFLNLVHY